MSELDALLQAFGEEGGDKSILARDDIAHIAANGQRLLSMKSVEGLDVRARRTLSGIKAVMIVKEGAVIKNPVHLCFGVLHRKGTQKIMMEVRMEPRASARFIAHCIFPKAEKVRHIMDAVVAIGAGADMEYSETHYHGLAGGVEVFPKSVVTIGKGGRYVSDFTLTRGRVGRLGIDYTVHAGEQAVAELTARVFGHADDAIAIRETIDLAGENARGLIKTRIAVEDDARADVTGITGGNAAGARGHVDCMELVKDRATARAVPIVNVSHPLAKVTHEAAIGSVDRGQMETLMARGLTPQEAVDVIVKGVLR